jgi:hypothetical protein
MKSFEEQLMDVEQAPGNGSDFVRAENMDKAIGEAPPTFSLVDVFKKTTREEIAVDFRGNLLDRFSAVQAVVIAKAWKDTFDLLEKGLRPDAINGTSAKITEVEIGGRVVAKIQEKNLPAKWNYNGDLKLAKLESDLSELEGKIDARKKFLQGLEEGTPDGDTGVILTPAKKDIPGKTISINLQ